MILSPALSLFLRFFHGFLGIGLGFITMIGNIMLGDSGTPRAYRSANLGINASRMMILSGIIAIIHHDTFMPYEWALAFSAGSIVLQVSAFFIR